MALHKVWIGQAYTQDSNWYISIECKPGSQSGFLYLHSDGIWRPSTHNENGEYTGYFDTEAKAKEYLEKFPYDNDSIATPQMDIEVYRSVISNYNNYCGDSGHWKNTIRPELDRLPAGDVFLSIHHSDEIFSASDKISAKIAHVMTNMGRGFTGIAILITNNVYRSDLTTVFNGVDLVTYRKAREALDVLVASMLDVDSDKPVNEK